LGSSDLVTRYRHFSAACSVGKCPRTVTARRYLAFSDSIAFVTGMKVSTPPVSLASRLWWGWSRLGYGATVRDMGRRE
jgi:hypothetical protein